MKTIADLAQALIEEIQARPMIDIRDADLIGQPLIDKLVEDRLIPSKCAHIEWSGVYEFGLVPVCSDGNWFNVHRDGRIDAF